MKTIGNLVWFVLALALLPGCRRGGADILALDLAELADAEYQTAWTLDQAIRAVDLFELAPDRPLGYSPMSGYDGRNLLLRLQDTLAMVGPDGRVVSSFSRKGRGPQEYISANPFLDPAGRILVLDTGRKRALTYLQDGTFVSVQEDTYAYDIHLFPDGSRAVMALPHEQKGANPAFSVLGPDGSVRDAAPAHPEDHTLFSYHAGHFQAGTAGSCYFRRDDLDTLYRLRPDRMEAVAAFLKPPKPTETPVRQHADGSVFIGKSVGRFEDRNCFVLADLLFYAFMDREKSGDHYLVYDLQTGSLLYHGAEPPTLDVNDWEIHLWPNFVHGQDAWCQLGRFDTSKVLPSFSRDSNEAFVHVRAR